MYYNSVLVNAVELGGGGAKLIISLDVGYRSLSSCIPFFNFLN